MQVTESEKFNAVTVMVVYYQDQNTVPMYGLGGFGTRSQRMTRELERFRTYVAKNENRIARIEIYANTYRKIGFFQPTAEILLLEWQNGHWTDHRVQNKTQFKTQKSGDDIEL